MAVIVQSVGEADWVASAKLGIMLEEAGARGHFYVLRTELITNGFCGALISPVGENVALLTVQSQGQWFRCVFRAQEGDGIAEICRRVNRR